MIELPFICDDTLKTENRSTLLCFNIIAIITHGLTNFSVKDYTSNSLINELNLINIRFLSKVSLTGTPQKNNTYKLHLRFIIYKMLANLKFTKSLIRKIKSQSQNFVYRYFLALSDNRTVL